MYWADLFFGGNEGQVFVGYTSARRSEIKISPGGKMKINLLGVAAAALACGLMLLPNQARATDKADVVATIHQFMDNLDPKTMDKALAACDSSTAIIDEFPPHVWNSCGEWVKAFGEFDEKNGIVAGDVKVGAPWSVDVAGDRAYFVAPATYAFKDHGKDMKELHAVFTAALKKTDGGWRITAWTWSKH